MRAHLIGGRSEDGKLGESRAPQRVGDTTRALERLREAVGGTWRDCLRSIGRLEDRAGHRRALAHRQRGQLGAASRNAGAVVESTDAIDQTFGAEAVDFELALHVGAEPQHQLFHVERIAA